jgi:hypothetical protein
MATNLIRVNNFAYRQARCGNTSFTLNPATSETPAIDSVAEQTFTVVALTGTLGPPATSTNAVLQFTSINTDIAVSVTSSAPGKGIIYYKVSDSTFGTTDIPNATVIAVTPNGWVPTISGKPFYVAPNQYVGIGIHANATGSVNLTMNSLGGAGAAITLSLSPWTHTTVA